ncbi:MAG: polysaccharide pyruvyl transferase family protein [Acidimicrobiales bacterium]
MAILGAPRDTGNLGVSALHESLVSGVRSARPGAAVTVFDNGLGRRRDSRPDGDVDLVGLRLTRRLHRPESLTTNLWALRIARRRLLVARALADADTVLDISGGDSFTDLYGDHRWKLVSGWKRLALAVGAPLVLAPQTYGPFRDPAHRLHARELVRSSRQAWARDADGLAALEDLLGPDFRPDVHRQGVDVAFGLEPGPAPRASPPGRSRVGVNVSGLVLNDPRSRQRFGIRIDYADVVRRVIDGLLAHPEVDVVLVAHVLGEGLDSDVAACRGLLTELESRHPDRVSMIAPETAGDAKAHIATCEWFLGTRMHATIAALSSGVPAATIAYSHKAAGVFAGVGQGDAVVDARSVSDHDCVDRVLELYSQRAERRVALSEAVAPVVQRARSQLGEMLAGP